MDSKQLDELLNSWFPEREIIESEVSFHLQPYAMHADYVISIIGEDETIELAVDTRLLTLAYYRIKNQIRQDVFYFEPCENEEELMTVLENMIKDNTIEDIYAKL